MLSTGDKIKGCLYGFVAGTELGMREGKRFEGQELSKELIDLSLYSEPRWDIPVFQDPKNTWRGSMTPLIKSVTRTYLKKGGRIIPEDWAEVLKNDETISKAGVFWWMDMYSSIELLKEGMNPRLTGYGACPTGHMCAAAVPVGIYHAGDPEYAYIDGIEIASVSQRNQGTEWAALTSVAVAEALRPDATAQTVIDTVMHIARKYAVDISYVIGHMLYLASGLKEEKFISCFYGQNRHDPCDWWGNNPIGYALMLLSAFPEDPGRLITISNMGKYPEVRTPIAGAIAGALSGIGSIPEIWKRETEKDVAEMTCLIDIVNAKLKKEKIIINNIEKISEKKDGIESLFNEKLLGCILAGAIGNAMGSVVEGKSYLEIDKMHPGGVTTVLEPSRLESEDDNQMAMLLTETYIRREGLPVTARDFGRTWYDKLNKHHFFYCMRSSYDMIRQGMDPRITGHWNLVTGSTVMCMEPVGAYHLCDSENAYIDALAISYMYQRGLDVITAGILAASVAEAFKCDATVDSIIQAALNAAPKEKMTTFDTRIIDTPYDFISKCIEVAVKYTDVLEVRKELYEKCLYYNFIDPLELLGLSYAMFKVSNGDVRKSAIGGTNIGRDSDTIAGRAAMLSGTLRGYKNIPKEWVDMIKPLSLKKIKYNTGRIEKVIIEKKLPCMKSRQNLI